MQQHAGRDDDRGVQDPVHLSRLFLVSGFEESPVVDSSRRLS
ncbi:hypothetical protein [Nesterenkonia pannonica]|nr:hypothetical protein [Nesterenkonia pannonica]